MSTSDISNFKLAKEVNCIHSGAHLGVYKCFHMLLNQHDFIKSSVTRLR